jgi:putative DNA primase/helicase
MRLEPLPMMMTMKRPKPLLMRERPTTEFWRPLGRSWAPIVRVWKDNSNAAGTMSANGSADLFLANLTHLPMWVGWREEQRGDDATKVPYDPRTGRQAESTNPKTWATRDEAETWAIENRGGVGIVLSQITGGDCCLCGIDLDTCRDPCTEAFQDWAQEVINRFSTYTEVSPSGTGAKLFFTVRATDLPTIERLFDGRGGRQFKNGGGKHCPAIEVYRTGRYFTVTDESIGASDIVRQVSVADLEWLLRDAGPKFAHKEGAAGTDQSGSGKAFRKGAALKASGHSYEQMRDALLADDDPAIAEWARSKGLASGEREMHRIYENASARTAAGPIPVPIWEDALAREFIDRHGDEFRYVDLWGRWMRWADVRWQHEATRLALDLAARICLDSARWFKDKNEAPPKDLGKFRTVSSVEMYARHERSVAATVEQWDADQELFNEPEGKESS